MKDVNLPDNYSQVAANVLSQKYLRKAGVPKKLKKVREKGVPIWLQKSVPDHKAMEDLPESEKFGEEVDGRQTFRRLAGALGLTGVGSMATLQRKKTLELIMMRCALC